MQDMRPFLDDLRQGNFRRALTENRVFKSIFRTGYPSTPRNQALIMFNNVFPEGVERQTRAGQQDRALESTDVVFWYTFGHTHIPRPEDYPVMPTAYIGFLLKPQGFFACNPANDVPPSPPKLAVKGACCH